MIIMLAELSSSQCFFFFSQFTQSVKKTWNDAEVDKKGMQTADGHLRANKKRIHNGWQIYYQLCH